MTTQNNELVMFNFNSQEIRTVLIEDEIWFVAKDICNVLELGNVSQSLSRLDDDEKRTLDYSQVITTNDNPDTTRLLAISESGLYALVLTSRKPQAKVFRKWITSEVIPSIRKTGKYEISKPKSTGDMLLEMVLAFKEQEERLNQIEQKVILEAQKTDEITQLVKQHDCEIGRLFSPDGNYYTIRGFASLKGLNINITEAAKYGKQAAKLSKELNYKTDSLSDPRYGRVGAYSEYVLNQLNW